MHEKLKVKVKSLSRVGLFATPWTAAYQAPPSMGFSRQEYWSGVPLPSLSWQIEGEKVEAVTDFLFLGSKITVDGDCSHEIKRHLLLGRKVITNQQHIENLPRFPGNGCVIAFLLRLGRNIDRLFCQFP